MRIIITILMLFSGNPTLAEAAPQAVEPEAKLIQVALYDHTAEELQEKLLLAENIAGGLNAKDQQPIVLVLEGESVQLFLREHYRDQKALVDQASRLSAFGFVELRVGQDYLDSHAIGNNEIPAFLAVVSSTDEAKIRLQNAGYVVY